MSASRTSAQRCGFTALAAALGALALGVPVAAGEAGAPQPPTDLAATVAVAVETLAAVDTAAAEAVAETVETLDLPEPTESVLAAPAAAEPSEAAPELEQPADPQPPAVEPAESEPVQAVLPAPVEAVQVAPLNVNVDVRVHSPGDAGAVTQLNAAVAAAAAQLEAPSAPRYQPEQPQYHGSEQVAPEPEEAPVAASPAPAPVAWEWEWNWDCSSATAPALPPELASGDWKWKWNWTGNCAPESAPMSNNATELQPRYQPLVVQYQPGNVNVSIRIASPGTNGPVVQANLAVAVAAVEAVAAAVQPAPAPAPVPAPPVAAPGPAASEPAAQAPEEALDALVTVFGLELECCWPLAIGSSWRFVTAPAAPAPFAHLDATEPHVAAVRAATSQAPAPVAFAAAVRRVGTLVLPQPAAAAARKARAQEERRRVAALPPPRSRPQARPPVLMTAGPAAAADYSLPLALLFLGAFVLAFADAARRARDVRTPPAAELGRPPDRPG